MLETTVSEHLDLETERALLDKARRGDRSALSRLLQAHYAAMYRLALRYCQDHDRALDALQESCVQVIRHIDKFRSEARFSSWMGRIVINSVRLGFRTDRRLIPVEVNHWNEHAGGGPTPETVAADRHYLSVVDGFLRQGREGDHELFMQRYVDGRSVKAISLQTGASIPAIKTRVHRAREKLREALRLSNAQAAYR